MRIQYSGAVVLDQHEKFSKAFTELKQAKSQLTDELEKMRLAKNEVWYGMVWEVKYFELIKKRRFKFSFPIIVV